MNVKCRVFGGKTGPFPNVKVFQLVRSFASTSCQILYIQEVAHMPQNGANADVMAISHR